MPMHLAARIVLSSGERTNTEVLQEVYYARSSQQDAVTEYLFLASLEDNDWFFGIFDFICVLVTVQFEVRLLKGTVG